MYNYDNNLAPLQENNLAWMDYYFRLKQLACTMFEWSGLPDTVNTRYLEETLFLYGKAVFFADEFGTWYALQCNVSGVNVYGDPLVYFPVSQAKQFKAQTPESAVLIRNTFDCFPTYITAYRYCTSLWSLDRARDVNVNAQKTPVLIVTDQKQKTTMENIYNKWVGNNPVIYGNKESLDPNAIKVLKTDAPFVAAQLQDLKTSIYNEYLTMLGVAKATEKKERQITNEVDQYEKEAIAASNILMAPRLEAAKEISKLLGNEVKVELRSDYEFLPVTYPGNSSAVNYTSERVGEGWTKDNG